ncbi:MAG: hypothetical protein NC405_03980 [Odoribacter sp.]|nr:hypothetical protein [Odoribacter sp.]
MQIQPEELLTFGTLRGYISFLVTEDEIVSKFVSTRSDAFSLDHKE